MLDLFALLILCLLVIVAIIAVILLAGLPGAIAHKRQHPQAQAVRVCGWMGLLTGGVLWTLALVWAYLDWPAGAEQTTPEAGGAGQ